MYFNHILTKVIICRFAIKYAVGPLVNMKQIQLICIFWRRPILLLFMIISVLLVIRFCCHEYCKNKPDKTSVNDDTFDCLPDITLRNLSQELLPEVDIFLRMFHGLLNYYEGLLVPSLKYFWPGNFTIVVVLDSESQTDRELGKVLAKKYPFPRVCFQGPTDPRIYQGLGHQRMQRDFFYPERFTSRKYVGYVDTDTVFVTKITRQLLFEEGKPVVIGVYGPTSDDFWNASSVITSKILKTKEVMKCMSYFPVIIRVEHVVLLRIYLEAIHGKPFDEIFSMYANLPISQFSMMCQYIWMFHRHDYKFYFNQRATIYGSPYWKGENNSVGREHYSFYDTVLTPEQRIPKPRSSVHYRYTHQWKRTENVRRILKTGLCFSGGFDECVDFCKDIERKSLQESMFHFEGSDWTWDSRCMEEQEKHYSIVKIEYSDENSKAVVREGCSRVPNMTLTISKADL